MKPKYYILIITIILGLLFLPKLVFAALIPSSSILSFVIVLIILIEAFVFWLLTKKVFRVQIKFPKILLATLTGSLLSGLLYFIFTSTYYLLVPAFYLIYTAQRIGINSFLIWSLILIGSLFVPYMIIKTVIYRLFLRKTDIGKSNLLKISLIVNLIVSFLLITLFFFDYRPVVKGKIIDAVTKEVMGGIKVERVIKFEICTIIECGSTAYKAASPSIRTDEKGNFEFGSKIIFKSPLSKFYVDYIIINSVYPEDYSEKRDNLDYYQAIEKVEQYKDVEQYKIELVPVVDSREECKDNEECIKYNSYRIALKNKDAGACLTYFRPNTCLRVVALLKEDSNVCTLCDAISIGEEYKFMEDKKREDCKKECLLCFGYNDKYDKEKRFCLKEFVCDSSYEEEEQLCLDFFE